MPTWTKVKPRTPDTFYLYLPPKASPDTPLQMVQLCEAGADADLYVAFAAQVGGKRVSEMHGWWWGPIEPSPPRPPDEEE